MSDVYDYMDDLEFVEDGRGISLTGGVREFNDTVVMLAVYGGMDEEEMKQRLDGNKKEKERAISFYRKLMEDEE